MRVRKLNLQFPWFIASRTSIVISESTGFVLIFSSIFCQSPHSQNWISNLSSIAFNGSLTFATSYWALKSIVDVSSPLRYLPNQPLLFLKITIADLLMAWFAPDMRQDPRISEDTETPLVSLFWSRLLWRDETSISECRGLLFWGGFQPPCPPMSWIKSYPCYLYFEISRPWYKANISSSLSM